jgi:hypothetical protein
MRTEFAKSRRDSTRDEHREERVNLDTDCDSDLSWRRAAKEPATVFEIWLRIARSLSSQTPRSRTVPVGVTPMSLIRSGVLGS